MSKKRTSLYKNLVITGLLTLGIQFTFVSSVFSETPLSEGEQALRNQFQNHLINREDLPRACGEIANKLDSLRKEYLELLKLRNQTTDANEKDLLMEQAQKKDQSRRDTSVHLMECLFNHADIESAPAGVTTDTTAYIELYTLHGGYYLFVSTKCEVCRPLAEKINKRIADRLISINRSYHDWVSEVVKQKQGKSKKYEGYFKDEFEFIKRESSSLMEQTEKWKRELENCEKKHCPDLERNMARWQINSLNSKDKTKPQYTFSTYGNTVIVKNSDGSPLDKPIDVFIQKEGSDLPIKQTTNQYGEIELPDEYNNTKGSIRIGNETYEFLSDEGRVVISSYLVPDNTEDKTPVVVSGLWMDSRLELRGYTGLAYVDAPSAGVGRVSSAGGVEDAIGKSPGDLDGYQVGFEMSYKTDLNLVPFHGSHSDTTNKDNHEQFFYTNFSYTDASDSNSGKRSVDPGSVSGAVFIAPNNRDTNPIYPFTGPGLPEGDWTYDFQSEYDRYDLEFGYRGICPTSNGWGGTSPAVSFIGGFGLLYHDTGLHQKGRATRAPNRLIEEDITYRTDNRFIGAVLSAGVIFDFGRFSIQGEYLAEPGYRDSEVDIHQTIGVSNGAERFDQALVLKDHGFDFNQGFRLGVSYALSNQWDVGLVADWYRESGVKIIPSSGAAGVADTRADSDDYETFGVQLSFNYAF